ncbi:MAG: hypothetical protein GF308_15450 [Candidatus Heimdallarchaeota archaeon]|nr:hypothetical protein [Candidatus Heimdallarchaeota archaeon]
MTGTTHFLKKFRLFFFPLLFLLELSLAVLFLILPFYEQSSGEAIRGYSLVFGWLLAIFALIIAFGTVLLFLSAFSDQLSRFSLLSNQKRLRLITFIIIFLVFVQIVLLAITQIYYTPFARETTSTSLLIIGLSLLLPVLLFFAANFAADSSEIFALSTEAPLRIKLTALWMIFLVGAMQIFATQWEIVIIGLILLGSTYYFFFLHNYSFILTPTVLIIHGAFSALVSIFYFVNLTQQVMNFQEMGFETFTATQAVIITTAFFVVPGLISLLLAQSLFRRWIINWIKETNLEIEEELILADYMEEE